jgi:hypothetical protein
MRVIAMLLLLLAGTTLHSVAARAQAASIAGSIAGSIAATATVLPIASFEGGAVRSLTVAVTPGDSARVEPNDGVRTTMHYATATRVTVSASPFHGPNGRTVAARLLCAHGSLGQASDAGAGTVFDCAAGFTAPTEGAGTSSVALAVGASVSAAASRGLPPGRYVGVVTMVASAAGY